MEPEDFPVSVELANSMQWNMTSEDFEFNRQLEPNGCFVLLDGSKPLGLVTCISYGQVGWFGNLIVNEAYRKQGAGTQLVKHAVNYLKSTGTTTVGLFAYPKMTAFYSALGFKRGTDFMVLKAKAVSTLRESEGNLEAVSLKNLPHAAALDSSCFGASRIRLLHLILKNPHNLGFVAVDGSEIVGYVAAKVFRGVAEVGPLVCRKSRLETALRLLKTILHRLGETEAYMYLSAADSALLATASKAGFREEFRLTRMFSGPVVAKNCIYLAESLERG
jgi:predicted N-acetyltransferase YhbS